MRMPGWPASLRCEVSMFYPDPLPCHCKITPRMMVLLVLSCVLIGLGGCRSGAGDPVVTDRPEAMGRAVALHLRGVAGDEAAARGAQRVFEALAESGADSPRLRVYRGSAMLLEAKRTALPWGKGDLVKRGVAMMDHAVEAAPEDAEVRRVRGSVAAGAARLDGGARAGRVGPACGGRDGATVGPRRLAAKRSGAFRGLRGFGRSRFA